ncbi:MAG: hypothetical protein AAB534_01225 [Patescibacteria group bacterium]
MKALVKALAALMAIIICFGVYYILFGVIPVAIASSEIGPSIIATHPDGLTGPGRWVKVAHMPVKVIDLDGPKGQDFVGLMQVEFETHTGGTLTAFVNFVAMPASISPAFIPWKVGDSIRIVEVPILVSDHTLVSVFLVVDWQQKKMD